MTQEALDNNVFVSHPTLAACFTVFTKVPSGDARSDAHQWPISGFQKALLIKPDQVQNLSCENEFYLHETNKNLNFHKKGFALGVVLKQRLVASWKWPISCW